MPLCNMPERNSADISYWRVRLFVSHLVLIVLILKTHALETRIHAFLHRNCRIRTQELPCEGAINHQSMMSFSDWLIFKLFSKFSTLTESAIVLVKFSNIVANAGRAL